MEPARASSPAATCPNHPEKAAIATCQRCGLFLCESCVAVQEPPLCAQCYAKSADPTGLMSEPFSVGASLRNGSRMFAGAIGPILLVCAIFAVPLGIIDYYLAEAGTSASWSLRVDQIYDGTVGLIGTIACLAMMVGVARGQRRSIGSALGEGVSAWGRVFGARFMAGLKIGLYTLLLIVPGILKALSLAVVTPAAYLEPHEDAHERSTSLTDGRRWPLLGLYLIAGVATILAAGLPAVLAGIASEAVPSAGIPASILVDWIARVAETWLGSVTLAAFFGLNKLRSF